MWDHRHCERVGHIIGGLRNSQIQDGFAIRAGFFP